MSTTKRVMLAVSHSGIFLLLSFLATGFGHGTFIFFALMKPYGMGLLFIPILVFISSQEKSNLFRRLFLLTVAIQYALAVIFVYQALPDDLPYFLKMWDRQPSAVACAAAWYLVGQMIVWINFVMRNRKVT